MADQYSADPRALSAPPSGGFAHTLSDTAEIAHPSKTNADGSAWKPRIVAISVAAASTLKVTLASGDVTTVPVVAGRTSMQVKLIWSTGTTLGSGTTVFVWYQ